MGTDQKQEPPSSSDTPSTTDDSAVEALERDIEHAGGEMAEALGGQDYTTSIVPLTKRRSNWVMFWLWATLQVSVAYMYTGYLARSQGLSLGDMILAGVLSAGVIFLYGSLASNLGAYTGQTHTLLTRTIYGRAGSGFVSVLLIIMGMGWYGFQAYFLALILQGLFGFSDSVVPVLSAIFGFVMITNNLFGFRGVAAYARYVAAPLLLAWGFYALIKGFATVPSHVLFSVPSGAATTTVPVIMGLLIGGAAWGNEPDIFRYSKPKPPWNLPTLGFGYLTGSLVFPVAGYLMAMLSNQSEFGAVMKYFVDFSLFGLVGLGVIVFFINQFALNDGNLYESINAMQNIFGWRRYLSVLILGVAGAVLAASMASVQNSFFIVANISGIFVPCATTIMAVDHFIVPRVFDLHRPTFKITTWANTAFINWVGVIALVIALVVGAYTGGLIPGTAGFGTTNIGLPTLQSWIIAGGAYLIGVAIVRGRSDAYRILGYPHDFKAPTSTPAVTPAPAGATG
jgi:purine-cytosine permease-like protein